MRKENSKCHVLSLWSIDPFCLPEEAYPGKMGALTAGWSVSSCSWCSAQRGLIVFFYRYEPAASCEEHISRRNRTCPKYHSYTHEQTLE